MNKTDLRNGQRHKAFGLVTVAAALAAACGNETPAVTTNTADATMTASRDSNTTASPAASSTAAPAGAPKAGSTSGPAGANQTMRATPAGMVAAPGAMASTTPATAAPASAATAGTGAANQAAAGSGVTIPPAMAMAAAGSGAAAQPAAACDAAKKDPEPKTASFKLLGGYQSMSEAPTTGPSKAVIEVHSGFPEWTVYRPETLEAEGLHEIMIWANGGCLLNSTIQGHFLLELASWGFVVVADGLPQDNNAGGDPAAGGIRSGPDAKPMVEAMDWITAENDRPCSPFYHKLDVSKIATGGQSCGGMMTMLSAGDKRVTTAMVFNSGTSGNNASLFDSYHAPMLFLAGGSSDFLSSSATSNVNAIDNVPIFYGNLQVGHGGTWESANGGEMGRVALGWLKWKLQGDATFEKMFVGADCELCKPPSEWTVVKKMMN